MVGSVYHQIKALDGREDRPPELVFVYEGEFFAVPYLFVWSDRLTLALSFVLGFVPPFCVFYLHNPSPNLTSSHSPFSIIYTYYT